MYQSRRLSAAVTFLAPLLFLLLLWALLIRVFNVNPRIFPDVTAVAVAGLDAVRDGSLFRHVGDRYPHQLSGGMQQRVGVVRALANEPDVLLMDEPFASVDAQTRMTLQEELTRIWQARRPTVLFITHDVNEAVFLANRVVVLSKGKVLAEIDVAVPRPRTWDAINEDTAFKALTSRALQLVRSA